MGQTQTVFLPPWEPTTDEEKEHADEFRAAIQALSLHAANFVAPHPVHLSPEFSFDWVEHRPFAEAAYTGDLRLCRLIPRLVPKKVSEEEFWRNYFSHVFAVKRSFEQKDAGQAAQPAPTGGATGAPSSVQPPPVSAHVSYPEKFHLAHKYASEGPPLPNLSDADRILLEALHQQATIGPCNIARPGMWDSAEDKAKYEAWKKLADMSRAEAMHLYVQAIEVFDADWMQWAGLRKNLQQNGGAAAGAAAAAGGGVIVHGGGGGGGADAALAALKELRLSLGKLPATQVAIVRSECAAMLQAIDALPRS